MTATLAAFVLTLSLNATGQSSCASCGSHHYGSLYRDHCHVWGRPLQPHPVVDPREAKHPIRVWNASKSIFPPGPYYGWGFRNDSPDGYGWHDSGVTLPLGFQADRTPDYFFRRDYAIPAQQLFFPTYYNAYLMRGQRYIPYTNCGGFHPAGGAPGGSSLTPVRPSQMNTGGEPVVPPPVLSGREVAPPEMRPEPSPETFMREP
jgi:hypothetical protein